MYVNFSCAGQPLVAYVHPATDGQPLGFIDFGNGTSISSLSAAECAALAVTVTALGHRLEAATDGTPHDYTPAPGNPRICGTCGMFRHTHRSSDEK